MNNELKVSSYIRGTTKNQISDQCKVAFYLRSATGDSGDLQKQRKLLERESKRFGFDSNEVSIYIDPHQSGLNDGPEFLRLKSDIAKGRINFVFISRLNRVSRSLKGLSSFFEFAKNNQFRFVSVNENMDSRYTSFLGGGK
tara:strand:+ start:3559 stop:3981 length:423 start_codon:yes stop_codon:yes gene_type:complete